MTYQRMRIRFSKTDELRYISHRDLVRTLERAFRRADLSLRRSQGYHPKAKMSFPLALALGIAGEEEVLEVELEGEVSPEEMAERLTAQLPPGLELKQVQSLEAHAPKAHVARVTYEVPVAADQCERIGDAVARLLEAGEYWIEREGREEPLDLLADLDCIEMVADRLRIVQRVTTVAAVQPRDILEALQFHDIDKALSATIRTRVELDLPHQQTGCPKPSTLQNKE